MIPPGFTTSGFPFMEPYAEHRAEPEDYPGLWHVTTGAPGVVREGRLLSRGELRQLDRRFAGLGGGPMDVAPATVSAVTRPEDALRLLRAMQRAALAARDRIPAWRVAWETMQDSHWTDLLWEADQTLEGLFGWGDPEDERDPLGETLEAEVEGAGRCMDEVWGGGWPKDRAQARKRGAYMEARWRLGRAVEGESRFHLIQAVETCANQLWAAINNTDETILADALLGPVGFTEQRGWHKINPRNVRVLRLAAREGSDPDYVSMEGELRFKPEDLVVLGVESLRGLVRLSEAPKRLRLGRAGRRVARVARPARGTGRARRGRAVMESGIRRQSWGDGTYWLHGTATAALPHLLSPETWASPGTTKGAVPSASFNTPMESLPGLYLYPPNDDPGNPWMAAEGAATATGTQGVILAFRHVDPALEMALDEDVVDWWGDPEYVDEVLLAPLSPALRARIRRWASCDRRDPACANALERLTRELWQALGGFPVLGRDWRSRVTGPFTIRVIAAEDDDNDLVGGRPVLILYAELEARAPVRRGRRR